MTGIDEIYLPELNPFEPERYALIDLDAVESNVRHIKSLIGDRSLIAIIKADAYGHGAPQIARAALAAGADMLGLVHAAEAIELRDWGIDAPMIAWLHTPHTDFMRAILRDIALGASGWDLDAIARAARSVGMRARVHLKLDTGLGRNGSTLEDWPKLVQRALKYQDAGLISVEGIFSHLAVADEPWNAETTVQIARLLEAVRDAEELGLDREKLMVHLANSPATLAASIPSHYGELALEDAVRCGLALYGLSPFYPHHSAEELGLKPAMTVGTFVSAVKEVPAGQGVSYGLRYQTEKPTTLALIPMGYADGVPRVAENAPVRLYPAGAPARTVRVVGRIAMDQMVVDLGEPGLSDPSYGYLGARAVLFGAGEDPAVEEWADAAGTINYEIVTRISSRVERIYTGGSEHSEELLYDPIQDESPIDEEFLAAWSEWHDEEFLAAWSERHQEDNTSDSDTESTPNA